MSLTCSILSCDPDPRHSPLPLGRLPIFYRFPKEHWKHLRTTNVVESPFAALRLRTDATKRYRRVDNATAVIWKMLMLAQQRFRRLAAPEKMKLT